MREKLIELLAKHCALKGKRCVGCDPGKYYRPECKTNLFGKIVDDLIANGVTFATDNNAGHKWIPVTERLPEEDGYYLCNVRSFAFRGSHYPAMLKYDKGGFIEGHIYTDAVTHWMPLPEPPKET